MKDKKEEKQKTNFKDFKIIVQYLKKRKLKLFMYLLLVGVTMLPDAFGPLLWGLGLEALVAKDMAMFCWYLIGYQTIHILAYSILMSPRQRLYNDLELEFTKNITKDLYIKVDQLPARAFEEIGVGEFINRLYNDPERVMSLLNKIIQLTLRSIVAIFAVILAFSISLVLGIEVIIFGFLMGLISYGYFPRIKKIQREIKQESDAYVKNATENITGIREIMSLGIKKNIEKSLFQTVDQLFHNSKKSANNEMDYYSINNGLYYLLQFVIILTCGYYFIEGHIAYTLFIMMQSYIWRIDSVVESISDFGVNFNKVAVSLSRMNDILQNRLYPDETFGDVTLTDPVGYVKMKNVKFRYSDEEDYTLKGLNLDVMPNKKIAIVGRSGNGKSTIFNLLLRYFDATSGEITIDDIPIQNLTEESLRHNISIIRQTPFLFNMSILDNFRLVNPKVTLKAVREICKKAYIDDYIMGLPKKYHTIIGEGGVNLSGGQKQRLAIARTLLLNTKIILFDEATSALDNESQEYIKKTIDDLVKDHTIIIVAHRLSTIVDADEINIIKNGKLEAKGTHQELLQNCKTYQNLYMTESNN